MAQRIVLCNILQLLPRAAELVCLALSEGFLRAQFAQVCAHASDVERRAGENLTLDWLLAQNAAFAPYDAARGWTREGGDLFETMKFLDSVGCSRYVVTDVAKDGMMSGPNIQLLSEVAERTDAKVTASGGISKLDDLRAIKELAEIGVDSAILGKSLYARAFTLQEALEVAK